MAGDKQAIRFPKSDFRYWEKRIFKNTYRDADGPRKEALAYAVRIAYGGRRAQFFLALANQREAAKKAREIYMVIVAEGWDVALERFRPDSAAEEPVPTEPVAELTVGRYIEKALAVAEVSPRSGADYARMLRRIAAEIGAVKGTKKRFGPKRGGAALWRAKVDALSLAILTPSALQAWKLARVGGSLDPVARSRAEATVNSTIRQAKALFSRKIVKLLRSEIELPTPLPFADTEFFKKGSSRYLSKIDAGALLSAGAQELGGDPTRREEWKILLLALCCGLRRREIDTLTWRQVDFRRRTLAVQATVFFRPKSVDSTGEIDLDPEVARALEALHAHATGVFVIESERLPRPESKITYYRCAEHFAELSRWLRAQGVEDLRPLHVLRKEAGSQVAAAHGLYDAQRFLRHSDPRVTAAVYLDKKEFVTTGLGGLLAPAPAPRRRGRVKGGAGE